MRQAAPTSVCIIVENLPVPFDRRGWLEARALQQAGYRVTVICPKTREYSASRETLDNIEIYRHAAWQGRSRLGYLVEYTWALLAETYLAWKVYWRSPFQILQACNPPDTIFLIAWMFKPLGVRFVFDHHDLSPELFEVKFGRRNVTYWILRLLERMTLRTADLYIGTNESFRQIAMERGSIDPERSMVVQSALRLSEVDAAEPMDELKRGRRFLVVYVGLMERQDGVATLIDSIERLVKEEGRRDTHFVLVGGGSEVEKLKRKVKERGLEEFVEFTGMVAHAEVCKYLATADVCVAPDSYNALNDNCTMVKTLEYMAFGKPVVIFDLKQGRASMGPAALYARADDAIDFGEKIACLLESETLRKTMGEEGRKRVVEKLNWDVQSEILINGYGSLQKRDERVLGLTETH